MSSWIFWLILAIVFGMFRSRKNGGFPKLPDGRDDTPLGPGQQRQWPPRTISTGEVVIPPVQESREIVHSTLEELHESVRVSTQIHAAPEYQNANRPQPDSEMERVFAGESSYDRIDTFAAGRSSQRRKPFVMQKEDLARAVVMAEILAPPRAKNPRQGIRKTSYR